MSTSSGSEKYLHYLVCFSVNWIHEKEMTLRHTIYLLKLILPQTYKVKPKCSSQWIEFYIYRGRQIEVALSLSQDHGVGSEEDEIPVKAKSKYYILK